MSASYFIVSEDLLRDVFDDASSGIKELELTLTEVKTAVWKNVLLCVEFPLVQLMIPILTVSERGP